MAWSWTVPFGIPQINYRPIQPILQTEYEWGIRALYCLNESDFLNSKLTSSLVHYLCREHCIFETGLASQRLLLDLNQWRKEVGIISSDGNPTQNAMQRFGDGMPVSAARARYYLSRPNSTLSVVAANANVSDLLYLCEFLRLGAPNDWKNKEDLCAHLMAYYANVNTPTVPDLNSETKPTKPKHAASLLGYDILCEVKVDMTRTILPNWLKRPPLEFATVNHGKLQSEEYKSLALVSFTITLV
ncbi:hypothetical protein FRC11_006796 [Ceratobasidium sp. 423]|nr:hypothetical protein FRC11_006796 [Ceratobasidium sp. 423]